MTFFDLTRITETERDPATMIGDARRPYREFTAMVPGGWEQGAGAFGGWVMAVLVRAVETCAPNRALRSLTAEIPAPVKVGEATISVEVFRAGQSVTVVGARLMQKGELCAHVVAILGAARPMSETTSHVDLLPPNVGDWRETPALPMDMPLLPAFASHFELRLVDGLPFQGAPRSGATGWIRARDPGPVKDAALVVAHVDAWWPAEFARMKAQRPMVTAAFTLQMIGGAAAWNTDAPLLHTSRTLAVRDGYVTEVRELWTEARELVALNEQTMVIVK
jgi:acyl-CoA thioesterase